MADKFLKDQIIFGTMRDDSVHETLLQERQLTPAKTIDMCRAAESAGAAKDMTTTSPTEISRVTAKKYSCKKWKDRRDVPHQEKKRCRFCGKWHVMKAAACPHLGKTCGKCGEKDHFATKCSYKVHQLSADDPEETLSSDTLVVTHQVCVLATGPRAKLRMQGKTKAFPVGHGRLGEPHQQP